MRVAVYTIALNEEQFVEPWFESAKEADYLLIADTGSTDKTVEKAKALGINVISVGIRPWRFDDARNASLAAIPLDIDYCIALDMDEILLPGWRKELEIAFSMKATRPRYQYTWNWKNIEETEPGLQYGGDKIHSRKGYRWKHPVHEVLTKYGPDPENQYWVGLEIHHHPDNSKPRSQYLPLLAQSVVEDPHDDRNAFYYARELFFYNRHEEAKEEFKRHLDLPTAVWPPERAASMRYLAKVDIENAREWLEKAIDQSPGRRESLVELAQYFYNREDWQNCYWRAIEALSIKEKPLDYLCEEFAWNELPYDLAAISAYRMGFFTEALEYGTEAVKINPEDQRLKTNLQYYTISVSS
jgi:glycosyltransferase involved in cell wall biosynthesis